MQLSQLSFPMGYLIHIVHRDLRSCSSRMVTVATAGLSVTGPKGLLRFPKKDSFPSGMLSSSIGTETLTLETVELKISVGVVPV